MKNPYEVLGVSPTATDDEVKSAYRALAKKYHPDNYADSPLSDVAEQKMKEINEAYDTIVEQRKNPGGQSAGGYTGNPYSGYNYNAANTKYRAVRLYIKENRHDEAQNLLNQVPEHQRDAEWHFLQGMIFYKKGWADQAYTYFETACRMEPSNSEFQAAYSRLQRQRTYGAGVYNTNSTGAGCGVCDICTGIMCADCCCSCMGGRGCC